MTERISLENARNKFNKYRELSTYFNYQGKDLTDKQKATRVISSIMEGVGFNMDSNYWKGYAGCPAMRENAADRLGEEIQKAKDANLSIATSDETLMMFCKNVSLYGDGKLSLNKTWDAMLGVIGEHIAQANNPKEERDNAYIDLQYKLITELDLPEKVVLTIDVR
jgi:hypothetical protein